MSQDLQLFTTILLELEMHGEARSRRSLESLVTERLEAGPSAQDLQALLFARALSRRLSPEPLDALNAYLRTQESRQPLPPPTDALPHVALAGQLANALLCQHLAGLEDAVLLDIGPGSGNQGVELLRQLGQREDRPRRLTVVLVEPDAMSLRAAENNLLEAAEAYGFPVEVMGFQALVEELDPSFWAVLASLPGTLLVHAAFALHQVHGEQRDAVLRRLRMLEPRALVLVEPNSDHASEDLEQRFRNCWRYFRRVFDLVDALALPEPERDALKLALGREIEDVLRGPEEHRARRHESVSGWWRRLQRAGFTRAALPAPSLPAPHPRVHPQRYPGYAGLDFDGETLVAVLCATPASRRRSW
ncbi:MAG TPA: GRAS family protein [Myxococcus sp.]|nr:GRAS family protein [Myxococcus sp.]